MLKVFSLLFITFIVVFFSSCGVNSDSSSRTTSSTSTTDPDSNITEPDSNITEPDSNITEPDSNITVPDSNITDPEPVRDSIYDEFACGHVDYKAMLDNSIYPEATYDPTFGLGVTSHYEMGLAAYKSEVILFHPLDLDKDPYSPRDVLVSEEYYSFSFDETWLENTNKTIYIRSPRDDNDTYECYRYELNSTDEGYIKSQMVLVHRD